MEKNNKTDFRTNFDQLIMLFGVALVVGPVTVMNESFILLGLVLAGMAMIALGVWRLGSQLLPERRVYVGLRQEVERFIDLVRRLNAHKISSDAALIEEVRAAMHESVDQMVILAGDPAAQVAEETTAQQPAA